MDIGIPDSLKWIYGATVIYIGLCAGLIAQKHGKNPLWYGLIAVISPLNLILLGLWAFGKFERTSTKNHDEDDAATSVGG